METYLPLLGDKFPEVNLRMLNLYNRYRRAVSPVIAVVLLIALTVAAVAVIWAITNGLLGGGTAALNPSEAAGTINGNTMTLSVKLDASEAVTLTGISLTNTTISTPITGTIGTANLDAGQTTVSFTFTTTGWSTGSYTATLSWHTDGGKNQELTIKFSA